MKVFEYINCRNRSHASRRDLVEYIIIYFMLFFGSSYFALVTGRISGMFRIWGLIIPLVVLLLFSKGIRFKTNSLLAFIFIVNIMLINFQIHNDLLYNFSILLLGGVLTGFFISTTITFDNFAKKFVNTITFLAIISLLVFFIACINYKILSVFPTIGSKYGYPVKSIFFCTWVQNAKVPQSYSIFWEPGAFQTFLSLAMIIELFVINQKFNWKSLLLAVTILTTFSTMGYFCLMFIILTYQVNKILSKNVPYRKRDKYFTIFLLLIICLMIILPWDYYIQVFSKLNGVFEQDTVLSHSAQTRIDAIKYPLKAFISSPIIGIGYDSFLYLNQFECNNNATFTILNWFALYGFLFGTAIIVGYFRIIKFCICPTIAKLLLAVCLVLMISSESYYTNPYIFALVFYGYSGGIHHAQSLSDTGNVSTQTIRKRYLY